jgi:hypothetical protein
MITIALVLFPFLGILFISIYIHVYMWVGTDLPSYVVIEISIGRSLNSIDLRPIGHIDTVFHIVLTSL